MRTTFFSPVSVGVAGNLSKATTRLQEHSVLVEIKSKGCVPSQVRGKIKLALYKILSLLQLSDNLY